MKKFWLFIVSVLLIIPFSVRAATYGVNPSEVSDSFYVGGYQISSYQYELGNATKDKMLCIDAGMPDPIRINNLETVGINNNFYKGLVAIFSAYDQEKAKDSSISFTLANDAARIYTALYDYKIQSSFAPKNDVSSENMIKMLQNAGYTLAKVDGSTPNSNNRSKVPNDGYSTIVNNNNNKYSKLQRIFCAGVKVYGNSKHSAVYANCSNSSKIPNVPTITDFNHSSDLNVNVFEVSRSNGSSDKVFSQYIKAKVTINPKDAKIKMTGCSVNNSNYECSIGDSLNKEIANDETFTVLVQTKDNNVINDDIQVNVTISYSFSGSSNYTIKLATCNTSNGTQCTHDFVYKYSINNSQRMVVISKTPGNDEGNVTFGVNVPKACQHQDNSYKVGNKDVTVKQYMEYGCCSDINVKDLTDPDDLAYYKDTCMDDDVVEFSNICGSSLGCLERDGLYQNNKYVGYSKSYIYQKSLKNVMKSVNNLETGAYKTNDLSNMYNEPQISNNLDKNYTSKLSAGNNYCMLYTSEDLNINFPGTTESVSGRSFVFEELTKDECQTNPDAPAKNCFRQPYVSGTLSMNFHTNVDRWLSDYQGAVSAVNDAKNKLSRAASVSDRDAAQAELDIANQRVTTLQNYKTECESYSNLNSKGWDYNLEPELTFYYDQKVYDKDDSPTITTKVTMVPSYNSVKYWPNTTSSTELSGGCSSNTASYNGFTYQTNKDCNYTAKKTVYYRPEKATYTLVSTGKTLLKTIDYEHEETINENGILVGYVYNTNISIEQGEYQTRFEIDNVGHNKDQANIQKSYTKYKEENKDASGHLYSKCIYCNRSSKTIRLCDTCPPSDEAIIYRSIATDNVTPQDRDNTNWSDVKGKAAEALIEASSSNKIISNVGDSYLALADSLIMSNSKKNSEDKTIALNSSVLADLYDDSSKEYLEYEITLTTKDMQIIKKNNNRSTFNYADFNICTNGKKVNKDENTDYCFVCNSSGKECESSFVDAFSDDSTLLANTRANKWKYFYYDATDVNNPGKFVSGSMKNYQDNEIFKKLFPEGKYPDPELVDAYLYVNKNWP